MDAAPRSLLAHEVPPGHPLRPVAEHINSVNVDLLMLQQPNTDHRAWLASVARDAMRLHEAAIAMMAAP